MIVNYTEQGWEIITQRAHGLLAAQIAVQWRKKDRPDRWVETLIAIADHDDAQTELEADDLLTLQGGPVDFKMKRFEPEHSQRLHDFSVSKSRYIALLTSMHMVFLYARETNINPLVKPFLAEQEKLQKAWRKALKITQKEATRIYGLLEWCDAFSLLLAQHEVQPENRTIEVSRGPDKRQYKLMQNSNGSLTVKPWPFDEKRFSLSLESRKLATLQFKSCEQFKKELAEADVVETIWRLEK
jgi:predicted transcriptional regulator